MNNVVTRTVAIAVALGASLILAGCTPATVVDSSVGPSTSSSPSPDSSPSPTIAAAKIPTDCTKLVSPATYASTFASTPLNDPGVVEFGQSGVITPTPAPPGASDDLVLRSGGELYCVWRNPQADITNFAVRVGTADSAVAQRVFVEAAAAGYTCADKHDGHVCQLMERDETYPVDVAHTLFVRDSVFIDISQANFPTHGVLGEMVTTIWG